VTALDDVSFTVNRREIVGLLGPNGAGKTTTINMVLGVLATTTGSVEIDGIDIAKRRAQALARTNFAAVYAPLPKLKTYVSASTNVPVQCNDLREIQLIECRPRGISVVNRRRSTTKHNRLTQKSRNLMVRE
jgi:ABC-type branched-subunit amino acid transport system ATPase component